MLRPRFFLVAVALILGCKQTSHESIKHMNEGIEAAQGQAYQKAIKELETAISLDPENHQAAYNLGQVYIRQQKWDDAAEALEQAVKYNNQDAMYHYKLGHAYLETGKPDVAITELEEALKLEPRLYKAHYFLGRAYAMQDNPKQAAEAWTQAAKLNPEFGKPSYELGKLYYTWDYYQEAVQVLVQAAQHSRDDVDRSNLFHQLGMSYEALGQNDKAIDAYKSALEERSDNLDAKLRLGMAYAEKGDKPNARKFLEEFVKQGGGGNAMFIQAANERLMKLAASE